MPARLTSAQRRGYFRDGILFPLPALVPRETAGYRMAADKLELALGGRPRTIEMRQMHLHFPWACALATHPQIVNAVEDLLGPNLLVWATELFVKHPHDVNISVGWHRDGKYSGFGSRNSTTAWVALGPSTVENGCLRAVPASRRDVDGQNPAEAVDVVLQAGQMSLHDADILHGSSANRSGEKRVGFVIRYITPDAFSHQGKVLAEGGTRRVADRAGLLLARGDAGAGVRLAPPPGEIDEQTALARMKNSAALHLEDILQHLKQPVGASGENH